MSPDGVRRRGAARPPAERLGVSVTSTVGRLPVARPRLEALARQVLRAEGVREAMVSVTIVTPRAIAALHREHLGVAGPTDVITFQLSGPRGAPVVGDAYVCLDVVRAQAAAHGVPLREELCRVVVHAMLHAVGHTHPEGPGRERSPMWRRQEQLLARATRRA
jgi:probable rRNA maturation factor